MIHPLLIMLAAIGFCTVCSLLMVGGLLLGIYLHTTRKSKRYPQLRVVEQVEKPAQKPARERDWQWPPKWIDPGAKVQLEPVVAVEMRRAA